MGGAGTVLTIDDEAALRGLYAAWLTLQGYETIEACDGESGLAQVRDARPDLVLCDLRMPGMDGLDVLSKIHEEQPDLPVIVISGEGSMTDAIEALKRGAWDYVAKPIIDVTLFNSAIARGMVHARLLRQEREHKEHLEKLNRKLERAFSQLRADQEAGRQIQSQLLPPDSQVLGNYRFTRRLFPSLYLSGDFVDYFAIDDTHVAFYMADVSGHGAASAFVTVMLKMLMNGYRTSLAHDGDQTILGAATTLERIDQDLGKLHLDKHLTMFYGILDRREHTVEYCNGGHYPYPLLCDGAQIRMLECPGPAIALMPNAKFESRMLSIPKKGRLFLASDGVLELLSQPTLAEKNVALCKAVTSSDFEVDEIVHRLGIDPHHVLLDDVAVLLLERTDHD